MTLHHGDCLDVMAQMEPESVDARLEQSATDAFEKVMDHVEPWASGRCQ